MPKHDFFSAFWGISILYSSPYPNPSQLPTLPQSMPAMLNNQPPEWVPALINDVKIIKSQVSKIENIEKTINQICGKIKEIETSVSDLDKRLATTEQSCSFISNQHDDHKKELDITKTELKK